MEYVIRSHIHLAIFSFIYIHGIYNGQEEESEINLTPMLDVVFIMLIFFIVTANFIKEPGLEINRPDEARHLKHV